LTAYPQHFEEVPNIKVYQKTFSASLVFEVLLYESETWTIKVSDARRITAAEMKYMKRTAGHT